MLNDCPKSVVCRKAKKSPPCAKGGQHGRAMQGGLCHFAWLHDRVRKHRLGAASHSLNPSVGVRRQLPLHKGGPVAGRPYCFCRIAPNQPPLWHWARIAKQSLPGDGLSHPEHQGRAAHTAWESFARPGTGPVRTPDPPCAKGGFFALIDTTGLCAFYLSNKPARSR